MVLSNFLSGYGQLQIIKCLHTHAFTESQTLNPFLLGVKGFQYATMLGSRDKLLPSAGCIYTEVWT